MPLLTAVANSTELKLFIFNSEFQKFCLFFELVRVQREHGFVYRSKGSTVNVNGVMKQFELEMTVFETFQSKLKFTKNEGYILTRLAELFFVFVNKISGNNKKRAHILFPNICRNKFLNWSR